jgi:hypothetical protein
MSRFWVFILPLLAAGFIYLDVGADHALALSIQPMANHSNESIVVAIACNPGSPNCIPYDPNSRLGKVKGQLKDQAGKIGGDEQDCQSKLCGIDTGNGTSAAKRGTGSQNPQPTNARTTMQNSGANLNAKTPSKLMQNSVTGAHYKDVRF